MGTCQGLDDSVRVGVLFGLRHCSGRGPGHGPHPQLALRHGIKPNGCSWRIRWPPRGRGGSWVVPAPSAHAEGRVCPSPPAYVSLPPQTQSGQCGFPQAGLQCKAIKERLGCHQAFACQAGYPSTQADILRRLLSAAVLVWVCPRFMLPCIIGNMALLH